MTKTVQGVKAYPDGTLIIHPDAQMKVAGDSIKIPESDTAAGAGFGDSLSDSDRAFAACREPIGYFLTFIVAADMVDKWFSVDDPDTEESDPELDRTVQQQLSKLKFKRRFKHALEMSRTFGKALLVGGFNDAKSQDDFMKSLRKGALLMQLEVYPRITQGDNGKPTKTHAFTVEVKDTNKNSFRYGKPVIYKLDRGAGAYSFVHYTRVVEVGDGTSVLDKVWDDMTCGRNIRWGAAQWMYRIGGGFPVVGFPEGTTVAQLESYHDSGAFRNLMSRTAIFVTQNSQMANDGMTFTFEGAAGHALDPVPFFHGNIEQIAIATGYPQAKLIGAQAGAVTGSEVNQQEYYKAISRDQEEAEDVVRWVIDHLVDSEQLTLLKATVDRGSKDYRFGLLRKAFKRLARKDYRHRVAENYEVTWNSAFELSELDEAQVKKLIADAHVAELGYKTPDEVRAEENLDPLPNGEGEKLKQQGLGMFNEEGKQPFGKEAKVGDESFIVTPVRHKKPVKREDKHERSDSSG